MPEDIWQLIFNETPESTHLSGVVTKLSSLLEHEKQLDVAYLCTANAVQISKFRNEGAHFCGYRNIQMLLLALGNEFLSGKGIEPDRITIPTLQRMIEKAWDAGINSHGRDLTGGVYGTRKHIGTSEVSTSTLQLTGWYD